MIYKIPVPVTPFIYIGVYGYTDIVITGVRTDILRIFYGYTDIMETSLFKAKVSFLPCVGADDTEITTTTLAKALLSSKWRAQVEAVRAETNPVKKALLKSGLPRKPTQAQRDAVKAEKDPKKREQLRNGLPCFLPSGTFERATDTGLLEHTGFISIDLDAKDNPNITDFSRLKEKISDVPHVAYCGQSCRGAGYVLIIPIADPAKHREHFNALQADFKKCGLIIDPSGINVSRKRFVSYDPDPYINTGAKVYARTMPGSAPQYSKPEPPDAATLKEFYALLEEIESAKIDITDNCDRDRMRKIATALINAFADNGLEYAQRLFQYAPGYDADITAENYNSLAGRQYAETLKTVNMYARQEIGKHDFDNLGL